MSLFYCLLRLHLFVKRARQTPRETKECTVRKKGDLVYKEGEAGGLSETFESPYIHADTSDNTRAADQSDIQYFLKFGGRLPA